MRICTKMRGLEKNVQSDFDMLLEGQISGGIFSAFCDQIASKCKLSADTRLVMRNHRLFVAPKLAKLRVYVHKFLNVYFFI